MESDMNNLPEPNPTWGSLHPGVEDSVVKLLLTEVKYDVKFDTWLREKTSNQEQKNYIRKHKNVDYAYKDDRGEDWLVRQIQDAVDNLHGELAWCLVERGHMVDDEILVNPTEWDFHFHFSQNWNGSIRAVRSAVRNYVKEYVLFNWYNAAMPKQAAVHMELMNRALENAYMQARSERVNLEPWNL